jgi:tetratricopeptide (TPR) repeat protein
MFLNEKNLAILIITRAIHRNAMSSFAAALMVGLSALSVVPAAAQPSNIGALNVREHISKGNTLLIRRDYEGAIGEYENALMADPNNQTAKDNIVLTHNNWGIDFFRHNKYADAREHWNTALQLNPNDRNAKNNLNVLRAQLKKLGLSPDGSPPKNDTANSGSDDEPKSGGAVLPKGAQTAREDNTPVPNAVIIGRPSPGGSQSSSAAASEGSNSSVTTSGGYGSSGSGASLITGSNSSSGSGGGASGAMIMPKSSSSYDPPKPAASLIPSSSTTSSAASTTPASSTQSFSSTTTTSSLSSSNIEDKLNALENKVYGRSSKDVPILQRLERLERDTSSRPSLGSINDRVQTLIKTYGL